MSEWGWWLLLIVAGFAAGIVNTIAGGGSFLTLPALMLFGMDPKLANGTNRIAVLFSSAAASATFDREGLLDRRQSLRLAVPTLLGTPLGTVAAVYLPAQAFQPVFGFIFLVMAGVLCWQPDRLLASQQRPQSSAGLQFAVFFGIGVYVGFIQAGLGVLLLLGMGWLNIGDLTNSNASKNLIAFVVTLVATIMFVLFGLVAWLPGLVMAVGNLAGGWVGAKLAIRRGKRLIFAFVIVVMLATGCKLVWDSWSAAPLLTDS